MQVLHLAATTRAFVQAKMWATRAHALGRFHVDLGQRAFFKAAFGAVDIGANGLKRQRAINEHHFAIGFVGHALGFEVQRFHFEPALGQRIFSWNCVGHA